LQSYEKIFKQRADNLYINFICIGSEPEKKPVMWTYKLLTIILVKKLSFYQITLNIAQISIT